MLGEILAGFFGFLWYLLVFSFLCYSEDETSLAVGGVDNFILVSREYLLQQIYS